MGFDPYDMALEEEFGFMQKALEEKMQYGFYYAVQSERIEPPQTNKPIGGGSAEDYKTYAFFCMLQNSSDFMSLLKDKRGNDLIEEFEVQLFCYRKKIKDIPVPNQKNELSRWFTYTENLINGTGSFRCSDLQSKYVQFEFDKWLKNKQKEYEITRSLENTNFEDFNNSRDGIKKEQNGSNSVENKIEEKLDIIINKFNDSEDVKNELKESNLENTNVKSNQMGNDFILSTIEDYLKPFEKIIQTPSYGSLVNSLKMYFTDGSFPENTLEIKVGKVSTKTFGSALYEIYKALKTNNETLSYEYLEFGKKNISIFKNSKLTRANMTKCNLYKYYANKRPMK